MTPPRVTLPAQTLHPHLLTEAQLHACVVGAARTAGWDARWTWKSLHSPKGTLDLMLLSLRPGRKTLFRELKGYDKRGRLGALTIEQVETIRLHRQAGDDAGVWLPEDWFSGRIDRELGLAPPDDALQRAQGEATR